MATLQIGAKAGYAGTRVERRTPAPARVETPFGSTVIVGGFPWGPTDKVPVHSGQGDYLEQRHLPVEGDPVNVQCEHFYERAAGAGRLATLRLVDGNQRRAFKDLYAKDMSADHLIGTPYAPPTRMMRVEGLYEGNRGGRLQQFQGYSSDRAAAFDAAAGTFDTGQALKINEWEKGVLHFQGFSRSFTIAGNTAAGVLSIEVPLGETGPTGAGMWWVLRAAQDPVDDLLGLGMHTLPSDRNPTTEFSLGIVDAAEDRIVDARYSSLGLNASLDSYADKVTEDGNRGRQHYLRVDVYPPGSPSVESQPASWAGFAVPTSGQAQTATLQTWFWSRVSPGGGTAFLDPSTITYPGRSLRCRAVCTFDTATTFDVQYEDWEGGIVLSDGLTNANGVGGTVGAAFASNGPFPGFTLRAGAVAMSPGDTVTVYFNPVQEDVSPDGWLLPDALSYPRARYRLTGTTVSSATISTSGDLSGMTPAGAPTVAAVPTAGTYDMSAPANRDFKFKINGGATITLTSTLTGPAETATALAGDLTTVAAAYFAANPPLQIAFGTGGTADANLAFNLLWSWGAGSSITVLTSGMGALLGYGSDTQIDGSDGTVVALAYHDLLEFGRDGHHDLQTADYVDAVDLNTSLLNDLAIERLGLFKVAIPGVYGYTEQLAAQEWCDANGHTFRGEIDPTLLAGYDGAADDWRNGMSGSENVSVAFQGYAYPRVMPFRGEPVAYPLTGAVLGAEARLAFDRGGYHIAAAGAKMDVGAIFRDLLETTPGETEPGLRVDEDILNAAGIQPVLKRGALLYPNGDENAADYWRGTVWKHKVECVLHLMHLLLEVGDLFTWEDNSPRTRAAIAAATVQPLQELFTAGWFRVEDGQTFFDVVKIDASSAQNPPSVTTLGECRVVVTISGIVDTIKNVVFVIGTGGVAVGAI